jgi:hypothetical protein
MVDQRIAETIVRKGFIYERWEKNVFDYGSRVSTDTIDKFANTRDASRQFDSGHIQLYQLHRVTP